MTEQEIIARMNELGALAESRMNQAPHNPHLQYAGILWMTQEEATEFLELRLMLPSAGQQREEAKLRIKHKIEKRKAKKMLDDLSVSL
jgi:hypothetical protein